MTEQDSVRGVSPATSEGDSPVNEVKELLREVLSIDEFKELLRGILKELQALGTQLKSHDQRSTAMSRRASFVQQVVDRSKTVSTCTSEDLLLLLTLFFELPLLSLQDTEAIAATDRLTDALRDLDLGNVS